MFNYYLFLLMLYFLGKESNAGTFSVDFPNQRFLKDGQPFRYISGEVHYFRIHPELWNDRLQRIRAAGLNAIQTYIPWNMHEPYPGYYDFSGALNITRFFSLAQQNGLNVLLRIGPFIDGEHENGGLPWWLLKYDGISLRTSDPNYINAVNRFYTYFLQILKLSLYKNGGSVLMLQIENEYGGFMYHNHICDKNYTYFLRDLVRGVLGNDTVLYTTDSTIENRLECGHINDTLTTVDFGLTIWTNVSDQDVIDYFKLQNSFNNNGGPNVDSEYYPGWFVSWGGNTAATHQPAWHIISNFEKIYSLNGSWSIYMFHGGTNFGFQNEFNVITSYDYGAPISENGDITQLYTDIRSLIQNFTDWDTKPLDVPQNNPMANYGVVNLKRVGTSLISTLIQIQEACHSTNYPMTFEQIDHPYGYVIYTTTLQIAGKNLSTPHIKDFGYVFLNNVYQGMLNKGNPTSINLNGANAGDALRILVENGGRQAYWTINDYKGLFNATFDGVTLQNWIQCGINLTEASINSLTGNFDSIIEDNSEDLSSLAATSQPGVFTGQFTANQLQDTFFNSTGWGKGQLFVNGFNLGRYWPLYGPQMTLYVPKPIIQPINNVLLIELVGTQQNYVNFIDHAIWTR